MKRNGLNIILVLAFVIITTSINTNIEDSAVFEDNDNLLQTVLSYGDKEDLSEAEKGEVWDMMYQLFSEFDIDTIKCSYKYNSLHIFADPDHQCSISCKNSMRYYP